MATSVFQGLARDPMESAPRNRARDLGCVPSPSSGVKYNDEGTIYYESRIGHRGLYDGWRAVQMGVNDQPNPPIGLSPWPVYGEHDDFALKLSTGERAYSGSNRDNQCTTWRGTQLSAIKERFIKYTVRVSLGDGGFSNAWDSFAIALDMQSQDNAKRSLAMFAVRATNIGDATHPYTKFSVTGDGPTHAWVDIAGSGDLNPGANENKQSEMVMGLVWDRTLNAGSAGYGGYHSAFVGGVHFDLTGAAFQASVGSSAEPPQLPDPVAHSTIEDFRETLNTGLILNRATSGTQAYIYPATAKVSGIVLSGHNLLGA